LKLGLGEIEILPLHHLGREKYNLLGRESKMDNYVIPDTRSMAKIKALFELFSL